MVATTSRMTITRERRVWRWRKMTTTTMATRRVDHHRRHRRSKSSSRSWIEIREKRTENKSDDGQDHSDWLVMRLEKGGECGGRWWREKTMKGGWMEGRKTHSLTHPLYLLTYLSRHDTSHPVLIVPCKTVSSTCCQQTNNKRGKINKEKRKKIINHTQNWCLKDMLNAWPWNSTYQHFFRTPLPSRERDNVYIYTIMLQYTEDTFLQYLITYHHVHRHGVYKGKNKFPSSPSSSSVAEATLADVTLAGGRGTSCDSTSLLDEQETSASHQPTRKGLSGGPTSSRKGDASQTIS